MIELLVGAISPLLDKFIPDADQRNKLAHEIATMTQRQAHEIAKAQIEVNKTEAGHKSLFVSGWRPAVGWVCVTGMGFNFVAVPLGNFMSTSAVQSQLNVSNDVVVTLTQPSHKAFIATVAYLKL